ncbi:MAG: PLP-dependent aminotransferase family protein [Ardenticatenaceae bacterium]
MSTIRTTQANVPDDVINLGLGLPGFSLLPLEIMRQAAEHRLTQGDSSLLQYGNEQGDGYFLLALADFLSEGYGVPVQADDLFVTGGNSQALDLICTVFSQPNDTVFVEEPTYFLALGIFADYNLNVVPLPTDENGLVIEALEEKLANQQPAFLYTVPTFHNPTGITLSQSRRERLVELSEEHNFLIVADEVYHLLNYATTPPPPPMGSYIESETVLSIGSFSKILAPGLRLGWVQAAPALLKRLILSGVVDSGGSLNHFTSGLVRSVLELGLQRQHLAHLKTTYRQRIVALNAALQEHMPNWVTFTKPEGGFFFWLHLPEEFDTKQLLAQAAPHKVGWKPGIRFSAQQGLGNCMRLSFSFYDADTLKEGVQRLKQVIVP